MIRFEGATPATGKAEEREVAATAALLPGRRVTERANPEHGEPRQKTLRARGPPQ
jgi:hypothetical protein